MTKKIKVLDCKACDNEYIHKDFHASLCYCIKYLEDNYGIESVIEYLQQVARTYFRPLSQSLKTRGLLVLKEHWNKIFSAENAGFMISTDNNTLVLEVNKCPAICHLKAKNLFYTEKFCLTTKIINETICREAGYDCSCEYESGEGKCIQRFWRGDSK